MNELALFAGAGGGLLGSKKLGWKTVCAVERDAYAAAVLAQRQNDGHLDIFPIWSDVRTFDGRPWRGIVDVISGGFPCQDISIAGKGAGIGGERSGLWSEFARIIREVRPKFVLVENSPALTFRGMGIVLGDLAKIGFDAEWCCISGFDTEYETIGERMWIVATSIVYGSQILCPYKTANSYQKKTIKKPDELDATSYRIKRLEKSLGERALRGTPDEVANRLDRFKAIGNGQDPFCMAEAVRRLMERINDH